MWCDWVLGCREQSPRKEVKVKRNQKWLEKSGKPIWNLHFSQTRRSAGRWRAALGEEHMWNSHIHMVPLRGTCWIWGNSPHVSAEEELNAQCTRYTKKCVVPGEARTRFQRMGSTEELCREDSWGVPGVTNLYYCVWHFLVLSLKVLSARDPLVLGTPGRLVSIMKRTGCVWFPKAKGSKVPERLTALNARERKPETCLSDLAIRKSLGTG